ncbi:hypothetical protein QTP88_010491 [Uroleucon formosanum]
MERRISMISSDIFSNLQNEIGNCSALSLALDESTDIQDKPQLAIFVRYVTMNMEVKEELLDLIALKETTRGCDIKDALDVVLRKAEVPIAKIVNVSTDGASSMTGCKNGLIEKDKNFPQLSDPQWLRDMSFCTDVVNHLATLNVSLQGKNKFINNLVQDIFSFQNKLKLFQKDLRTNNLNHFPYLKKIEDYLVGIATKLNCEDYVQKLECLSTHFEDRFKDLKLLKPSIAILENPFVINVIENGWPILKSISMDTAALEIELLELLEDEELKQFKCSCHSLLEFRKHVPVIKYPKISLCAQKLISIFGTTYSCESLYSTMKMIKSKHRSTLTDGHLTELLRTALTTYSPDFKKLTSKTNTQQIRK